MAYYNPKLKQRSWISADRIEQVATQQIYNLSKLPDLFRWVAIMPDVHPGFGMPIGGVIALKENVIPNAVGVDIGCGVVSIKTNLHLEEFKKNILRDLLTTLLREIPVGEKWRKQALKSDFMNRKITDPIIETEIQHAKQQLGTLGGGNHFIEFQKDPDNSVYISLHSGSRNLGYKVARFYNEMAKKYCKMNRLDSPPGLSWLSRGSELGKNYIEAMTFCIDFASENRRLLSESVLNITEKFFPNIKEIERIETVHNYSALEEHYGELVMVHRKGAVRAVGKVVIPGSMGSASYIGEGLSNPLSYNSCSHGAGRILGRQQARDKLNFKDVKEDMDKRNIILITPNKEAVLEEAREAYKDIDEIMNLQNDLVKKLTRLEPLGVIKG